MFNSILTECSMKDYVIPTLLDGYDVLCSIKG